MDDLVTEHMEMEIPRVDVGMTGENDELFPALGLGDEMDMSFSWHPEVDRTCDEAAAVQLAVTMSGGETGRPTVYVPPPTAAPTRAVVALLCQMSVSGVEAKAFQNEAYLAVFKATVAKTLERVEKEDVSNVHVVEASRRRLDEPLNVAYDVVVYEEVLNGATADEFQADVEADLSASVDSGDFADDLVAEAEASGDAVVLNYAEATTVLDVAVDVVENEAGGGGGGGDDDDGSPMIGGLDDSLVMAVLARAVTKLRGAFKMLCESFGVNGLSASRATRPLGRSASRPAVSPRPFRPDRGAQVLAAAGVGVMVLLGAAFCTRVPKSEPVIEKGTPREGKSPVHDAGDFEMQNRFKRASSTVEGKTPPEMRASRMV